MPQSSARRVAAPIAAALLLGSGAAAIGGVAQSHDRNRDRIPDRWERAHRLSLSVDQAKRDQDRDGLTNRYEYLSRTSPRKRDSDRDGRGDAAEDRDRDGLTNLAEQRLGTLPNNGDTDRDGTPDGLEATDEVGSVQGAVVRFTASSGVLVVGTPGTADAREVVVTDSTVQERIGPEGLIEGLPVEVEFVVTVSGRLRATRIVGPAPVATGDTRGAKRSERAWRRFCADTGSDGWERFWSDYWRVRGKGRDVSEWDRHWDRHWRSRFVVRWAARERSRSHRARVKRWKQRDDRRERSTGKGGDRKHDRERKRDRD